MEIAIAFSVRLILVLLFLPFSALDKVANVSGAVGQASEVFRSRTIARLLVVCGLAAEVFGSLAVLSGLAGRTASEAACIRCRYRPYSRHRSVELPERAGVAQG